MSAIYGAIGRYERYAPIKAAKKMRARLTHRVTDGEGEWHHDQAAFGFCRLSLYPQQEDEQLPFVSGDLVIVADCRLDNRELLMKRLGLDAVQTFWYADAELILLAYRKWTTACPDYLDGEFAFAILDKQTCELFAATDPVGCRPFFYCLESGSFLFCSEIKGIAAAMSRQQVFDEEHLFDKHFLRGDPARTYVKGIHALCGGRTLQFRNGVCSVRSYWQLAPRGKYRFRTDGEWIEQLRELVIRAVEKRISPVGNTGISLSGGLDSGTLAGILASTLAAKNKPLYAFSSVLPEGHEGVERDERRYIDLLRTMHPNIVQTFVDAGNTGPFDPVETAFATDEAIPNAYFYLEQSLLSAAREKGVRTFYTGLGGDSSVTSPKSGVYQLVRQGAFASAFRIARALSVYDDTSLFRVIRREYLIHTPIWGAVRSFIRHPEHPAVMSHFKPGFLDNYLPRLTTTPERVVGANLILSIHNGRFGRILGALANRNAWYGIASCDPLFDRDLLEFMADVPVHLYTAGGQRRGFIRAAVEGIIPPEIRWRKDKLPYGPDFVRRALRKADYMAAELSSARYDMVFDRFFSRESVLARLPELQPFGGFSSNTSLQSIRTLQAVLSVQTLAYLRDEGFQFEPVGDY
jgi:asparagine synthase (glutamine-hydrolysing)